MRRRKKNERWKTLKKWPEKKSRPGVRKSWKTKENGRTVWEENANTKNARGGKNCRNSGREGQTANVYTIMGYCCKLRAYEDRTWSIARRFVVDHYFVLYIYTFASSIHYFYKLLPPLMLFVFGLSVHNVLPFSCISSTVVGPSFLIFHFFLKMFFHFASPFLFFMDLRGIEPYSHQTASWYILSKNYFI